MIYRITLTPTDAGWALRAPELAGELAFLSGARAEAAGRDLAARLARAGRTVELHIVLRNGEVAATVLYPAAQAA